MLYHAEHDTDPPEGPYQQGFDGSRSIDPQPRTTAAPDHLRFKGNAVDRPSLNPEHLKVIHEVATAELKRRGWKLKKHVEWFDEFVSICETKLIDILANREPSQQPIHAILAGPDEPAKAYLRTIFKNEILNESRPMLSIPRTTRAYRVRREIEFEDYKRHSLHSLYGDEGVKNKVEDENSHWPGVLSTKDWDDFQELLDCCRELYFLPGNDDLDKKILMVRWRGCIHIPFGMQTPEDMKTPFEAGLPSDVEQPREPPWGMLHVDDVAWLVGVKPKLVQQRLNQLEERYHKRQGSRPRNGRMPKGDRRLTASAAA